MNEKRIKIIAHRSGPCCYPEQTIASAEFALSQGADMIEIDVRFTKDYKLAVSHDSNLKRVFGVTKILSELTAEEFQRLRHKDAPDSKAHLLKDYLNEGIRPLLIHIKEDSVIEQLVILLREYHYSGEDVVFGVQTINAAKTVRELLPNGKILAFMPDMTLADDFIQSGVNYIRLWENWLKELKVSYPVPVWIMTNACGVGVTTKENLKRLLAMDIGGILINDVRLI